MYSHLMQVSKQDILNCLHFIPSNLRLSYNTWSAQSCCSALLHHIWVWILFFVSLSQSEFLGIFLSVFPYDEHHRSAHSLLTECLLHVEYGEALISSFYTSSLSVNESRHVQWCTNQVLVDMDAKKKNRTDLFKLAFIRKTTHYLILLNLTWFVLFHLTNLYLLKTIVQ